MASESQLKSDRAEVHRRLAAAIESGRPASADQNAALIAAHLEPAGELRAAYGWHMRAGAWSATRDIAAARGSVGSRLVVLTTDLVVAHLHRDIYGQSDLT